MPIQYPVRAIRRPSYSGSRDKDGPEFIRFVDGLQPKIHEVWTLGEDDVTPEVHLTAHVDFRAFVGQYFATNYLNPN